MSEIEPNVGIVGTTVTESLSPVLHNSAYREMGLGGKLRYGIFQFPKIEDEAERSADFLDRIHQLSEGGVIGFSVTAPFKEIAYDKSVEPLLLDSFPSTSISPDARINVEPSGSVNTLKLLENGSWEGFSTDGYGAVSALEALGVEVEGSKALIIGAGGAGRAIAFELASRGVPMVLANRDYERAFQLGIDLRAKYPGGNFIAEKLDHLDRRYDSMHSLIDGYSLIFQCTTVGQKDKGAEDRSPLTDLTVGRLAGNVALLEAVYLPERTPLVVQVEQLKPGAMIALGTEMLLRQAVKQVEIFTGEEDIPIDDMRTAMNEELSRRASLS